MRVTVFDYGAGNLHSLVKALEGPARTIHVESDPVAVVKTDVLVLPGVGAFASAAARLAPGLTSMRDALNAGLPCIGICLGMQLLFDQSAEGPGFGLGIIAGGVRRLSAGRVPQIGWNSIEASTDPLLGPQALHTAYYANSYVCAPEDPGSVVAWTTHERDRFPAAVRTHRVLGVQFHPEKSSAPGIRMLHDFLEATRA